MTNNRIIKQTISKTIQTITKKYITFLSKNPSAQRAINVLQFTRKKARLILIRLNAFFELLLALPFRKITNIARLILAIYNF
jgi:hypothetical protein